MPGLVFILALLFLTVSSLAAAQSKQLPPKPLDINKATAAELEKVPGIGPVTAKAIIKFREKSGPFRRLEDLLAIRGITKRKLEKLRLYLTVKPPAPPPAKLNGLSFRGPVPARSGRPEESRRFALHST